MKKIISFFICCCILCLQLPLSACICKHEWQISVDTTTCETNGLTTYKCDKCGKTKQEERSAYGHKWEKTSSTATCSQAGFDIYTCNNCHKTKKESVNATGHIFNQDGYCKYCDKFKYNITVSNSLPAELFYLHYDYSRFKIEKVEFYISYSGYVCASFYGEKTYDSKGAYGTNNVGFVFVIYDSKGNIMGSRSVLVANKIVGEKFTKDGFLIDPNNLSMWETYTLKLASIV